MIVSDVMTKDPICVDASDPITVAIDLLNELDVRHLPVLEGDELVGMLSDRDLRTYDISLLSHNDDDDADYREILVSGVMSADSYVVAPDDDLADIVRLMIDQKFGAVPVVDPIDGTLCGIVSYIDLLRVFEEMLDE